MKLFTNVAVVKVFTGVLLICVVALSFFYGFKKIHQNSNKSLVEGVRVQKNAKLTISPTPTTSPTATPIPVKRIVPIPSPTQALIDCVGPDGKHLQLSQQDCDNFNSAWKSTPTPTQQSNTQSSDSSNNNAQSGASTSNFSSTWQEAQEILQEKQSQYSVCAGAAKTSVQACEHGCGLWVSGQLVASAPDYGGCLDNCTAQYNSQLNVCVAQSKVQ